MPSETRRGPLMALAFGHFVVDIQTSALAVLIPLIHAQLHLQYSAAAAIITVQYLTSSVVQPLFGVLSDRRPMRTILPVATLLATLGTGTVLLMPSYGLVLAVVIFTGLGSALFHAAGSLHTNFVSGNNKATGISFFFAGGNTGFAVGPLMMIALLGAFGPIGSAGAIVPGVLGSLVLLVFLRHFATTEDWRVRRAHLSLAYPRREGRDWATIISLSVVVLVISLRSVIQTGLVTFIPLYFTALKPDNPGYAALLLSVFVFTGALGTIVGGPLADRFGRKPLLVGSMLLVTPLLAVFLNSDGLPQIISIGIAGAALISASALTVVIAQELLPHNIGLASGLTLGLGFGAGGLGAVGLGLVGDRYGLQTTMLVIAVLPLLLVLLSLLLPATGSQRSEPAPGTPDVTPAG